MSQKFALIALAVLVLFGLTMIFEPGVGQFGRTGTLILSVIATCFLLWLLYRGIKHNPEAFSGHNLSRSATTLGVLALILIAVIAFVVMLLK